jgi:hypothetical protein
MRVFAHMKNRALVPLLVLLAVPACTTPSTTSAPPKSSSDNTASTAAVPDPAPAPDPAPSEPPAESSAPAPSAPSCSASQFVVCESGPACARRKGVLIDANRTCFDRAKDACDALACKHGCNVHNGNPKEIHCAVNAASSSHMKRCGGLANWACPENMRCAFGPDAEKTDDALGSCVLIN